MAKVKRPKVDKSLLDKSIEELLTLKELASETLEAVLAIKLAEERFKGGYFLEEFRAQRHLTYKTIAENCIQTIIPGGSLPELNRLRELLNWEGTPDWMKYGGI